MDNKTRVIILGSGFRAEFYIRILLAYSNIFSLEYVLCHRSEKCMEISNKYGVKTTLDKELCLELKPHFVINAVSKPNIFEMTMFFLENNIPVLSETGGIYSDSQLEFLANFIKTRKSIFLIAEQYFLYPLIQGYKKIIDLGFIGDVTSVNSLYCHDYHSFCLIKFLLSDSNPSSILAYSTKSNVTKTSSREGLLFDGEIVPAKRTNFILNFRDSIATHSFLDVSYRSTIRKRSINIEGLRGLIDNLEVRYLDHKNITQVEKIEIRDETCYFLDKVLSENKYFSTLKSEEESSIANYIFNMLECINGGIPIYDPLDALHDVYLTNILNKALENENVAIKIDVPNWYQKNKEKEE
ncbi:MAG: hypothetical protein LBV58_03480 [Acholeplasmatales bacterium]|jgi:predicted dehydrogenase|nr:hypothetical protein [Acholeplasmatales bacterium]